MTLEQLVSELRDLEQRTAACARIANTSFARGWESQGQVYARDAEHLRLAIKLLSLRDQSIDVEAPT